MKYRYEKIIQGKYGPGWDDLTSYNCDSTGWIKDRKTREENKNDWRAYRDNEPQYAHRIIKRKILL